MPPKQATLGYVRDSQTTLGLVMTLFVFWPKLTLYRNFFGKPNGTKPPPKQSTLSFSTKSSSKNETASPSSAKENEDNQQKDGDSDIDMEPKLERGEQGEIDAPKQELKNSLSFFSSC